MHATAGAAGQVYQAASWSSDRRVGVPCHPSSSPTHISLGDGVAAGVQTVVVINHQLLIISHILLSSSSLLEISYHCQASVHVVSHCDC